MTKKKSTPREIEETIDAEGPEPNTTDAPSDKQSDTKALVALPEKLQEFANKFGEEGANAQSLFDSFYKGLTEAEKNTVFTLKVTYQGTDKTTLTHILFANEIRGEWFTTEAWKASLSEKDDNGKTPTGMFGSETTVKFLQDLKSDHGVNFEFLLADKNAAFGRTVAHIFAVTGNKEAYKFVGYNKGAKDDTSLTSIDLLENAELSEVLKVDAISATALPKLSEDILTAGLADKSFDTDRMKAMVTGAAKAAEVLLKQKQVETVFAKKSTVAPAFLDSIYAAFNTVTGGLFQAWSVGNIICKVATFANKSTNASVIGHTLNISNATCSAFNASQIKQLMSLPCNDKNETAQQINKQNEHKLSSCWASSDCGKCVSIGEKQKELEEIKKVNKGLNERFEVINSGSCNGLKHDLIDSVPTQAVLEATFVLSGSKVGFDPLKNTIYGPRQCKDAMKHPVYGLTQQGDIALMNMPADPSGFAIKNRMVDNQPVKLKLKARIEKLDCDVVANDKGIFDLSDAIAQCDTKLVGEKAPLDCIGCE